MPLLVEALVDASSGLAGGGTAAAAAGLLVLMMIVVVVDDVLPARFCIIFLIFFEIECHII